MSFSEPLFCIDMGTTNCRVFVSDGGSIRARVEAAFGIRDVARGRSPVELLQQLESLLAEAASRARSSGMQATPRYALGAGMLTSAQGLMEIAHIPAPARDVDLARQMKRYPAPLAGKIDLYLVPGIRTGSNSGEIAETLLSDLMRGEETLVTGLLAAGRMDGNAALLNLGSHWKWVWVDGERRIAGSRTALTGELIHVSQCQTLLASALPGGKPAILHDEWLEVGRRETRRSGLTRALFCVRLLEQAGQRTPEERLSFFYGAFLELELMAFAQVAPSFSLRSIYITGPPALAEAWRKSLDRHTVHVIREEDRDQSYVEGLGHIFALSRAEGLV